MENAEGSDNERSSPDAVLDFKDHSELAEPPPPIEAVASSASGCSEQDGSHGIPQVAETSSLAVHKDYGGERHLDSNSSNELSEKLAERKNSCVPTRTIEESSMAPANECDGNGLLKKFTAREFSSEGCAASAVEVSEPSKPRRLSGLASAERNAGSDSIESPYTFSSNQTHANGAHCDSGYFLKDFDITPSGNQQLQAAFDDNPVQLAGTDNAVGTEPLVRTLAPTDGGKLTSVVVPAGSSDRSHEHAVGELDLQSDKAVRIDSCTEEQVQERLCTDHKSEHVKQNLDTVCREDARFGQKAEKLRQQRDEARERVEQLEKQIVVLQDLHDGDSEFYLEKVANLREKNGRLSALNTAVNMQELLSTLDHVSLSDVISYQLELQLAIDWLRQELRLKEEEVRSLNAAFQRSRSKSEKMYAAAIDDITKSDTMLQRAIHTLEAEIEVVSGCPALMQLLHALRSGGATEEGAASSSDTPPSPPSPPSPTSPPSPPSPPSAPSAPSAPSPPSPPSDAKLASRKPPADT